MNIGMSLISGNTLNNQGTVKIPVVEKAPSLTDKITDGAGAEKSEKTKDLNVHISMEGLQKQAAEVTESEEAASQSPADAAIAKIKEMIERVKKEIEKLANDDSEEAQSKIKMLQGQLATLNASLMEAMNKKDEIAQKAKN